VKTGKKNTGTIASRFRQILLYYSYQNGKWEKPGSLSTKRCSFGYRGVLYREVPSSLNVKSLSEGILSQEYLTEGRGKEHVALGRGGGAAANE